MKKNISIISIGLVLHFSIVPAVAQDLLARYEKVIWIDQIKQKGAAYEQGCKLFEFPVMTGDDETTTDPGLYVIKKKEENYYSRKYDTPMPYSLFFDLQQRKAIHEGEVPPPAARKEFATHGCVHVDQPYIEWLFDWTEEGKTAVVIEGWRTGD
jgi:lipoprotein-anchoring transpeptidase ErfK/SrfK